MLSEKKQELQVHGDTVYLFVAEELVGNLDDAFRAQLLALEVEADKKE